MIREKFQAFLEELLAETTRFYGDRLVTLAVFGSVGRGTQRADSDIDIMLIAEPLPAGRLKRLREFEQVEEALEPALRQLKDAGIHTCLSPVIKTPREILRGSLLFLDLIEDSIFLFDRNGFFRGFLEDFKKRLEKLGARRVKRGNAWHWVLKEDYREGEVFEL
ncbi:MAG: nucleotidyltransferase domain-containing protein [Peptococcaceae bacterium]|nr:nucleotidyltransferase domain-containing protein [Peptococcaceae bacterium]